MAQGFASFTVLSTDAVNTTYVVAHGLSLPPQIFIVGLNGQSSTGAPVEQTYQKSMGLATAAKGQSIIQYCTGAHSDDNNATQTQADVSFRNDCVGCELPPGLNDTVTQGKLSLTAVDGTNLTFTLTETFQTSSLVKVWYIAGSDLTWIDLSQYQGPIATGSQSYVTPGFQPTFMLFLGDHLSQAIPFVQPDSPTHIGAVDANLNQWAWAGGENTAGGGGAAGSGRATTYMVSGQCLAIMKNAANAINTQASLTSFDPSGFTLNFNAINLDSGQTTGRRFVGLAVQGGQWAVGSFNSFTDTTLHTITNTLPFTPEGMMVVSANKPASASLTVDTASENMSVGFVSGSTNSALYIGQQGIPWSPTPGHTVVFTDQDATFCYLNVSNSVARVGTAKITLITNGFQWQHTTADPQANLVGYVAYATQPPAATRTTVIKTVKPNGGGDYLSLHDALAGELVVNKNMTTKNIILQFDLYEGFDTTTATIPGVNNTGGRGYQTGPSNYILINAVKHHGGFPDASGASNLFDMNMDNGANGIVIQAEYVRFKNCQIRSNMITGGSSGSNACYFIASTGMVAPTFWVFDNCIAFANWPTTLVSNAQAFHAPAVAFTGCTAVHVNCAAFDFLNQDKSVTSFNNANTTLQNIYYYNCGAYNGQAGFQDRSDVINKNCVAIGCDFGWLKTTGRNAASDYNFSTCGPVETNGNFDPRTLTPGGNLDVSGPHSNAGFAPYFTNPPLDYTPAPGDTQLLGTGTDLSADAIYPFNYDITGFLRPAGQWSRGPYQGRVGLAVPQCVWWTWVNAVTDTTAIVKAKMMLPSTAIFLEYSTDPNFQANLGSISASTSTPTGGTNNIAQWNLVQLASNTRYYYRIIDEFGTIFYPPGIHSLSFSTFPTPNQPASFSFGVGACSNTGANTRLYDKLGSLGLLFYITNGEWHYCNINVSGARTLHEQALDTVLTGHRRALMWSTMGHDYTFDDHDTGIGNTDQTTPALPDAIDNYRANCPSYFLPDVGPTFCGKNAIYHSFVCGRVRVVVLDTRTYRDPNGNADGPTHYMIGPQQLAWLKNELLTAKQQNQYVFMVSTVDWIGTPSDNGSSEWPAFSFDQKRVSDYIQSIGLTAMAVTTGDMHSSAIDSGADELTTSDGLGNHLVVYNPFPEHQNNAVWGIPYDIVGGINNPLFHTGSQLMGFAGVVTIQDSGTQMTVNYQIYNELGLVANYQKTYDLPPSPATGGGPGPGGNPRAVVRQLGFRVQTEGDMIEEMDRRIEGIRPRGK